MSWNKNPTWVVDVDTAPSGTANDFALLFLQSMMPPKESSSERVAAIAGRMLELVKAIRALHPSDTQLTVGPRRSSRNGNPKPPRPSRRNGRRRANATGQECAEAYSLCWALENIRDMIGKGRDRFRGNLPKALRA